MPTEYYLDDAVTAVVCSVVQNEQYSEIQGLRDNDTAFLVAAVRKVNKDGETQPTSGPPVVVRKISPADAVFLPGFQFKIFVDMHRWEAANADQHIAMVHRELERIVVEIKESGIKYSIRRPDVQTCFENVARFGAWEKPLLVLRSNFDLAKKLAATTGKSYESFVGP